MSDEPIAAKIKYLGKTPRTFNLPIPFVSKSGKTGEVICDPVGEFPIEDAKQLLDIPGSNSVFELVEYVYGPQSPSPENESGPLCACGCGERIVHKASHKYSGTPKYILGHFKKKAAVAAPSEG